MRDVIYEMSSKKLGMTCVVDAAGQLLGIITDGDLRRHMAGGNGILERTAGDVMTPDPVTLLPDTLAAEALNMHGAAQDHVDRRRSRPGTRRVAGVVHLHDLWRTEMILGR